ncbi:MAG: hypothetical protein JSR66_19750 [Proteobacteria bacterium]|nr:hypothetical protein [Pseudomonadota bacterium]
MNKLIAIGMSVFGLGLGGWSGYQLGSAGSDAPLAKADTPALAKLVPGLSTGRADVDSATLRALIREEMTAVLAKPGSSLPTAPQPGKSGGAPAASTPAQEAVSPEVQAQRREALEQASALVAQGTWGNEQRMSFREKLAMLDPQQRDQAMQQFATAINNGSLTVTTDGPPL